MRHVSELVATHATISKLSKAAQEELLAAAEADEAETIARIRGREVPTTGAMLEAARAERAARRTVRR